MVISKKLKVPYLRQFNDNACGAACLQMIYLYNGIANISQEEIFDKHKKNNPDSIEDQYILVEDLVADAKSRGFENTCLKQLDYSNKEEVVRIFNDIIETDLPIIVCQRLTKKSNPIGHFRVVLGISYNKFFLHDPHRKIGGGNRTWSIKKFMEHWQPHGTNVIGGIYIVVKK